MGESELSTAILGRIARKPPMSAARVLTYDGRVERILAWKLDRLARNPIDGGALIHFLGKDNLKEIVTLEGSYTGSGDSKFMLSVLFGAATKMTDDLVMGVRRGNKAVHEKGRITGAPPLGYMKVRDRRGFRGAGMVVPDPERFPILKRAFEDVLTGTHTVADTWRRAVAAGLTTRETAAGPSAPISIHHFYKVLQNSFYCGEVVRCGEVYPGEHEPMITVADFHRVQELVHRKPTTRPKDREHVFPYRGLLRCGHCGRALSGERVKGRFVYYRCTRRRAGLPVCRPPAPSEAQVTVAIEASLATIALPQTIVDWTLRAVDFHVERERARLERDKRRQQDELARAQQTLDELTDMRLAGDLSDAEYRKRRPALVERLEQLQRDLEDPTARLEEWRSFIAGMLHTGAAALETFLGGTDDEKRQLLAEVYANLPVKDRILAPELRFPYRLLADAPRIFADEQQEDANRVPPPEAVLNRRENARPRSRRERACLAWWTWQDSNLHAVSGWGF